MIIRRFRHYKTGLIERLNDKHVKQANLTNRYLVKLPEGKLNENGESHQFALTMEQAKHIINTSLFTEPSTK
jgi:hypothetical protein